MPYWDIALLLHYMTNTYENTSTRSVQQGSTTFSPATPARLAAHGAHVDIPASTDHFAIRLAAASLLKAGRHCPTTQGAKPCLLVQEEEVVGRVE